MEGDWPGLPLPGYPPSPPVRPKYTQNQPHHESTLSGPNIRDKRAVPNDLLKNSGHDIENQDCPEKIGTSRHLTVGATYDIWTICAANLRSFVGTIARGLASKWKQPVVYDFDKDFTKDKLFQVIKEEGSLWKNLQISRNKVSFTYPVDMTREVWVFADIPHLIKLLRDNVLDYSIRLPCGTEVSKLQRTRGRKNKVSSSDEEEALAGYLTHCSKNENVMNKKPSLNEGGWIESLSRGGLAIPSQALLAIVNSAEKILNSCHESGTWCNTDFLYAAYCEISEHRSTDMKETRQDSDYHTTNLIQSAICDKSPQLTTLTQGMSFSSCHNLLLYSTKRPACRKFTIDAESCREWHCRISGVCRRIEVSLHLVEHMARWHTGTYVTALEVDSRSVSAIVILVCRDHSRGNRWDGSLLHIMTEVSPVPESIAFPCVEVALHMTSIQHPHACLSGIVSDNTEARQPSVPGTPVSQARQMTSLVSEVLERDWPISARHLLSAPAWAATTPRYYESDHAVAKYSSQSLVQPIRERERQKDTFVSMYCVSKNHRHRCSVLETTALLDPYIVNSYSSDQTEDTRCNLFTLFSIAVAMPPPPPPNGRTTITSDSVTSAQIRNKTRYIMGEFGIGKLPAARCALFQNQRNACHSVRDNRKQKSQDKEQAHSEAICITRGESIAVTANTLTVRILSNIDNDNTLTSTDHRLHSYITCGTSKHFTQLFDRLWTSRPLGADERSTTTYSLCQLYTRHFFFLERRGLAGGMAVDSAATGADQRKPENASLTVLYRGHRHVQATHITALVQQLHFCSLATRLSLQPLFCHNDLHPCIILHPALKSS
ncbi:hypothetical protein PR048_022632 [Dryococelus australis]|uniref:Transposable element P transposase n=1 Tax=Dryococelus australis TaxID=614101 RepID=A0ABQ9H1L0_9NEOP|nr:hypothetical protein PR048_022632 [Dryococelus australis]